jgi:hypothetical protein
MIPFVLAALFVALLVGAWMWHAKRSDPASYASSSGFALFEESLSKNKL